MEQAKGTAEMQGDLARSKVGVTIKKNNADARVAEAARERIPGPGRCSRSQRHGAGECDRRAIGREGQVCARYPGDWRQRLRRARWPRCNGDAFPQWRRLSQAWATRASRPHRIYSASLRCYSARDAQFARSLRQDTAPRKIASPIAFG